MTAQTITGAAAAPRPTGRPLAGLGALVRKDATEWLRGRRAWVIAILTTAFMVLAAANGWITAQIIANLPDGATAPHPASLVPLDNLLAAVGSPASAPSSARTSPSGPAGSAPGSCSA